MSVAVRKQLGGSLPWLLPFSYLCSTSIATQAFNAFDCEVFEVDEARPEITISYLASVRVSVRVRVSYPYPYPYPYPYAYP